MAAAARERPRLADARAVVARYERAENAWEALAAAGVIPVEWVADERRRWDADAFDGYCRACHGRRPSCRFCGGTDWPSYPHPRAPEHCALFASDVPGVLAAEQTARELLQAPGRGRWRGGLGRFAEWVPPPDAAIVWSVADEPPPQRPRWVRAMPAGYYIFEHEAETHPRVIRLVALVP